MTAAGADLVGEAAPRAGRGGVPPVLAAAGALLLAYLVSPFVTGLASLDGAALAATLRTAAAAGALRTSLATATLSTAAVLAAGVPLAYVLARGRFPGRRLVEALVYLPLVVPPLAGGVLLLTLYGPYAPVGSWLGVRGVQISDAWPGIVLAQVFVSAPYLVIAARVAFEGIDPALERASYALGAPPLETFFRVSLPLAWPGILAGLPLVWLRSLGEFGATVMVAYHPYSLPVYLFVQFGVRGLRTALPVAALLVLAGAAGLVFVSLADRRGRAHVSV